MKKLIKLALRSAGFELRRIQPEQSDTMASTLLKWAASTEVNTIIDVGASNGCWTRLALKGWPNAQYLLVEAQRESLVSQVWLDWPLRTRKFSMSLRQPALRMEQSFLTGVTRSEALPARHSGIGISVPVVALDNEIKNRNLRGPFLLKLDTHGFEVPILRGASRILAESSLLVIESYNFDISPECLRFPQFCRYLEDLGFRCIDICDVLP